MQNIFSSRFVMSQATEKATRDVYFYNYLTSSNYVIYYFVVISPSFPLYFETKGISSGKLKPESALKLQVNSTMA